MADETKDFGEQIFPVPPKVREKAYIKSRAEYEKMYKESIENPDAFWAKQAERLDWFKKWDKVMDYDFAKDKHLREVLRGRQAQRQPTTASTGIWNPSKQQGRHLLRGQLPRRQQDPHLQDTVRARSTSSPTSSRRTASRRATGSAIYLPMIPELAIAMLACTRIGAIHCIVFGGFSSDALRDRIQDSDVKAAHHLRRHLPRRQGRSSEDQRRQRRSETARVEKMHRRQAHRRQGRP